MAICGGVALLLVYLIRSAWMAEDGYISFRVVENFLNGYGLRWNVGERVQTFTDPLFVGMVTLATWVSGNVFFACCAVSLLLTLAAFLLLTRTASAAGVATVTMVLLFSKGFMDFSVSGLENPATHLALAAYFFAYWKNRDPFILTLIAAFAATNRIDTILLLLPSLCAVYVRTGPRVWKRALAGWTPYLVWTAFALFYYGFALPNTYYAKLHTGIPVRDRIFQGFVYLVNAFRCDTVTIFAICAGVAIAFLARQWWAGAGAILYCLYVVWIGGDFMSARFFTAPLVVCVALIANYWKPSPAPAVITIAVILALGMSIPSPTVLSARADWGTMTVDGGGIADERAVYFQGASLLNYHRDFLWPTTFGWSGLGEDLKAKGVKVYVFGNIGFLGYHAGPGVHVIDFNALGDALIARLPAVAGPWRIGHHARAVPAGYEETVSTGVNKIADPNLAEYYNHLKVVICGNLWSWQRFEEIVLFNIGYYDHLLPKRPGYTTLHYHWDTMRVTEPLTLPARFLRRNGRYVEVLDQERRHAMIRVRDPLRSLAGR
jgi:arabinofuranosyltransferase